MRKLLLIALAVLGLVGCGNQSTEVKTTSISLSETTKAMYLGEQANLVALVKPENATYKAVSWASSDSSIVSVSESGALSALKKGSCKITAKTKDTGLEAFCDIAVGEYVPCTDFKFGKTTHTVDLKGQMELNITFLPSDVSLKKLTYEIKDPSIVSIDENGLVKGLCEGTTVVFASHKDLSKSVQLTFNVKEAFDTGLYIGEKPVKYEGTQYSNIHGNYSYTYENNTLVVDGGVINNKDLALKEYEGIRLEDSTKVGKVGFFLSYEGKRPLTIEFMGDVKIALVDAYEGLAGFLYVKNEVNVYLNGPSLISSTVLTHSLIYTTKASFFIDNLYINLDCSDICYGIVANTARFASSEFTCAVDKSTVGLATKYAGLYIGNGVSASDTKFDIDGFRFGAYCGTTYLYDCYFSAAATFLSVNFYALTTYDTEIILISSSSGAAFYDGLYMHGGSIYSQSEYYYAIASNEATLLFEGVTVNAICGNGNGIEAWRVWFYNSTVKSKVNNGYAIKCDYNAHVPVDEKAKVAVYNSDVEAVSEVLGCAIWGIGLFEMEDASFTNGEKYLFADILVKSMFEDQIFAICDKDATELEYEQTEKSYIPTNGVKSLAIERAF